jgi:hypothetical protein
MDQKARLKRLGIGAAATLVATVIAGAVFGSLAVPLVLAAGLGVTVLAGGGLGRKGP